MNAIKKIKGVLSWMCGVGENCWLGSPSISCWDGLSKLNINRRSCLVYISFILLIMINIYIIYIN